MIRIGTSGWSYDHWTDVLYPAGLPVSKRLARYVEEFDTVELNASFYRWPRDAAFTGWRQRLPDGFTMSVKAHRGLTHFPSTEVTGALGRAFRAVLEDTRRPGGGAAGPIAPRAGARRRPAGPLPRPHAAVDSRGDGVASSIVERPCRVLAAGTAPGRLRGDERRRSVLCTACDQRPGLRPHAWSGTGLAVLRLLSRQGACVNGPTASWRGRTRASGSTCTSTTTSAGMRCATRAGCGSW